jgi:hypothetical protein
MQTGSDRKYIARATTAVKNDSILLHVPPNITPEYARERKRKLERYIEFCEDYNFDMIKVKVMLP